jgi:hypothetical protein
MSVLFRLNLEDYSYGGSFILILKQNSPITIKVIPKGLDSKKEIIYT